MRIVVVASLSTAVVALACASLPTSGTLGESSALHPRIVSADTAHPPGGSSVELDEPGYVAVLLVAPGLNATLLYPPDSTTNNRLDAGTHQLMFHVPNLLVQFDSARNSDRAPLGRRQRDSSNLNPGRQRYDTNSRSRQGGTNALTPTTPTYLLLFTSPQPLVYQRLVEKTAGVSIPTIDTEALNAVAKAIKATIPGESREWAAYYQRIELRKRN